MSVSLRYLSRYHDPIRLCTESIQLPANGNVLWDDIAGQAHLQKRFSEVHMQRQWESAFLSLPTAESKVRRLEALGPIARAWVQAIPTDRSLSLSDAELRYGYRYLLLSPFAECNDPAPSNLCPRCNRRPGGDRHTVSLTHFMACDKNQALRSRRHHAIANALGLRFQEVYRKPLIREAIVAERINNGRRSVNLRSDIRILRDDGMFADYDVGVTTVHGRNQMSWPTEDQVQSLVAEWGARSANQRRNRHQWDIGVHDHEKFDELTHPDTKRISALRQLSWEAGVLPVLREMHSDKVRHYQQGGIEVTPLVMSAGGSVTEVTRDTIHSLCYAFSPDDGSERTESRRRLYGPLSVLLLRFGHFMATDQLKFLGAQYGYAGRGDMRVG